MKIFTTEIKLKSSQNIATYFLEARNTICTSLQCSVIPLFSSQDQAISDEASSDESLQTTLNENVKCSTGIIRLTSSLH